MAAGRHPYWAKMMLMTFPALNDAFEPVAALVVLVAVAVLLRVLWRTLFFRQREPGRLQGWLAENTATPVFLLILAAGAQAIFWRIAGLPRVREFPLTPYVLGTSYALTVLSATWVVYGLFKGLSEWYVATMASRARPALDSQVVPAFRLAVKILLVFTAATIILDHYNVKLTALLTFAGVGSLAVALAAQDTLANMFAGFTIMLDRPFRVGDRVELTDGRIGDVQAIGLRSTRILSLDNTLYVIPNAELAKSRVINHSSPGDKINVRQKIALPYGNNLEKVKQILVETCRAHPLVLPSPAPSALLSEWGDTFMRLSFNFWISDYRTAAQVVDEINTAIYAKFAQEGIRMKDQLPKTQ